MAKKNKNKEAQEREKEILNNMDLLGISREEAEEMWAFDHDEMECEEVDALEEKVKENKKPVGSPLDKVKNSKAKKKADKEKQAIIKTVFDFLGEMSTDGRIVNPQEMAANKISFKGPDGGYYTLSITKHKNCPDGYKED